jgi:hypothetical protein
VVVFVRTGVLKMDPVESRVPPVGALYHITCSVASAVKDRLPGLQDTTSAVIGSGGIGFTIAIDITRALGHPLFASA